MAGSLRAASTWPFGWVRGRIPQGWSGSRLFFQLAPAIVSVAIFAQAEDLEFFEKKVRPILANDCRMCHNDKVKTGGLDLTTAGGYLAARAEGFFGAADRPEESLMLKALSFEQRVKMPPQGKLSEEKLAVVKQWLSDGAPWPGAEQAGAARRVVKSAESPLAGPVAGCDSLGPGLIKHDNGGIVSTMDYTLEQFAADCRAALQADPGVAGRDVVKTEDQGYA